MSGSRVASETAVSSCCLLVETAGRGHAGLANEVFAGARLLEDRAGTARYTGRKVAKIARNVLGPSFCIIAAKWFQTASGEKSNVLAPVGGYRPPGTSAAEILKDKPSAVTFF